MRDTHPELMCVPTGVAYDFEKRTGRLDMMPGHCCHMSGCIDLFKRIDPNVRRIETFAGGEKDTSYAWSRGRWWSITDGYQPE